MTLINAKKIRAKDINIAYDVIVGHLQKNPQHISKDSTPQNSAIYLIETKLKDINSQMAPIAGRVLETHQNSLNSGKNSPQTYEDLSSEAQLWVENILGKDFQNQSSPPSSPQPSSQKANTMTHAKYIIKDGKSETMNALLGSILKSTTIKIENVVDFYNMLLDNLEQTKTIFAELETKTQNKESITDTPRIARITKSEYATLPVKGTLVVGLNDMMENYVTPDLTWAALIAGIGEVEKELDKLYTKELNLRKKATLAAVQTKPTTSHNSLDEIEDRDTDIQSLGPYDVADIKASDLFPGSYGAPASLLSFDVPTIIINDLDVPDIDPTYRFYVPVLTEALHCIASNEIMWLYGDSGCGKSEFWKQVAARLGMPFIRMNMDGHLTRSDIVGSMKFVNDSKGNSVMKFLEGILPRAMQKPCLLLIDELDLGDPEVMAVLQPVLEGEPLRLLEDNGRIVHPHPNFRIAITGNTTGLGAHGNAYVNVYEQSAATRDRISAFVEMPYMTPQIEKEVIEARMPGIDKKFLENLIKLANMVRTGYRQNDVNQIFSTRSTLAAARRYQRFSALYPDQNEAIQAILETVILNRMDDTSRAAVKGYMNQLF
jgi:cobaltochelatase CobS